MRRWQLAVVILILTLNPSLAVRADDVRDCCGPIASVLYPPEVLNIGNDMPRLAEQATLLFLGKVVKAESVPCCDDFVEVTLRTSKLWKGVGLAQAVVVHTGGAADNPFPFAIGQEYLVATLGRQDSKGRYALHPGFRPVERSNASGLIEALDEWRRAKNNGSPSK